MINKLFLLSATLGAAVALGCISYAANPTANLTVKVTGVSAGGACPGGDSGFVPAGYTCVVSETDEFNGTSIDTSKWGLSGTPTCSEGGGYLTLTMNNNSSCGVWSKFNLPSAPAYIEWRRRLNPYQTSNSLYQFWTCYSKSNFNGDCIAGHTGNSGISEETDADMGAQCSNRVDPGATNFYSLCTDLWGWQNGSANIANFVNASYSGPAIGNGNAFHIIGLQRLATPSPNGTLIWSVDGCVVKTMGAASAITSCGNTAPNYPMSWGPYWVTPPSGGAGGNDYFIVELFCSSGSCPNMTIDYVRTYCVVGQSC